MESLLAPWKLSGRFHTTIIVSFRTSSTIVGRLIRDLQEARQSRMVQAIELFERGAVSLADPGEKMQVVLGRGCPAFFAPFTRRFFSCHQWAPANRSIDEYRFVYIQFNRIAFRLARPIIGANLQSGWQYPH